MGKGVRKKNWKDKTCEECIFMADKECRRYPQFKNVWVSKLLTFEKPRPSVWKWYFLPACAEYNPTPHTTEKE